MRRRRRKPSKHYLTHKERARAFIHARAAHYAAAHGFAYNRIAIRNTRRSWGSCSELGNLNFNYKLLFLPADVADYVIVHELCHLWEFNHSPAFWRHVATILPDYTHRRHRLRTLERLPVHRMRIG